MLSWDYCLNALVHLCYVFSSEVHVTDSVPAGPYQVPILLRREKRKTQGPSEELKDPKIKLV